MFFIYIIKINDKRLLITLVFLKVFIEQELIIINLLNIKCRIQITVILIAASIN